MKIILYRRYRFLRETGGASRASARRNIVHFAITYAEKEVSQ